MKKKQPGCLDAAKTLVPVRCSRCDTVRELALSDLKMKSSFSCSCGARLRVNTDAFQRISDEMMGLQGSVERMLSRLK